MKELKKKVTTEYNWHRNDHKDIPEEHVQELEDCANDRINQMVSEGYREGQLCATLGDEEAEYFGWWSCKKED